jgi:hypothetical protein
MTWAAAPSTGTHAGLTLSDLSDGPANTGWGCWRSLGSAHAPMRKACRLAGTDLTQNERFALLALRNRAQLFQWERDLMAPHIMERLAALGLTVLDGDRWDPTPKGIELIARLSGHELSSIGLPDMLGLGGEKPSA